MRKIRILITIAIITSVISCKNEEKKDFVTFSGKIANQNSDSIMVSNFEYEYNKVIKVKPDGTFNDTLKIHTGIYRLFDGAESTNLHLKNGDVIHMTLDTKAFDETIQYSGTGAEASNILAQSTIDKEKIFADDTLFSLPKDQFQTKIKDYLANLEQRLVNKNLDSVFVLSQKTNIDGLVKYLNQEYDDRSYAKEFLARGKQAPKFVDYKNFKGGKTSLDDLKGKYVYIDVWATWCVPCKKEIPFLQKVEEQYHGKEIEFVSISVDDNRDFETWEKMITDKKMGGVQLFSNRDTTLLKNYRISGIPRFILLDPEGNIINVNAPRPSDPKLIELFNSLKI